MPAILSDTEAVSSWLDPQVHGLDALKVLRPVDMNEVSSIINSFDFLAFLSPYNLFVTSKNETTNSPIHKFEVLQIVFKMKKQGVECFFKVRNNKKYTIKKGFQKTLWPFCRTLNSWIGEFMISFFDVTNRKKNVLDQ